MREPYLLVVVLLAGLYPNGAAAYDRALTPAEIERLTCEHQLVPLKPLIDATAKRLGGRLVGVELETHDDTFGYELKWLDAQGKLLEIHYDAVSGALKQTKPGEVD
ncbi:MAG: PepSY domain-containing protein [Thiotrichales bacterium]